MKIEENTALGSLTTMRVGGPARFFSVVANEKELADVLYFAEEKGAHYFVLGEGSNILVADNGISGLVLSLSANAIALEDYPGGRAALIADAGAHWDDAVAVAVSKNLHGVENLSLIPGTMGASPVQNIGAYGAELAATVLWVEAFDSRAKKRVRLSKSECGFHYRDSIFKQKEGAGLIITRVALVLEKDAAPDISYKDVREYFRAHAGRPTIAETRAAIIAIRRAKLPDITRVGTAGSFFKNPILSESEYEKLRATHPDIPGFQLRLPAHAGAGGIKVPLAWILDRVCGLKGFRDGAVGTYETQPLTIVNHGGATANEIMAFAEKIRRAVQEKTGILPEYEVSLVGNWDNKKTC